MSQIKKSASFRSRIPVRRTKPLPRRCYSPEPDYRRQAASIYTSPLHGNTHMQRATHESEFNAIQSPLIRPREKVKRQRHFEVNADQNTDNPLMADTGLANGGGAGSGGGGVGSGAVRPKTIYSSSSFSSSDESRESEAPLQVCLCA